jgi:post-segregation antitoxin (ccd killing protein)
VLHWRASLIATQAIAKVISKTENKKFSERAKKRATMQGFADRSGVATEVADL